MIKIHTTHDDLLNLRFSYSPMFEVMASFRVLHGTKAEQVYYADWVESANQALQDVEFPYMDSMLLFHPYVPDFLTLPPANKRNLSLDDELTRLMETSNVLIREDVQYLIDADGTSPIRQLMMSYPKETLVCLIDEIRLYWERVLAPHWSQIITILEGDMLYRGRMLAVDGTNAVLSNLTNRIAYLEDQQTIGLHKDHHDPYKSEIQLKGRGLHFIPAMFMSSEHLMWMVNPHHPPLFFYSARGAGMWKQSIPESNQSLELALGAGRARVLTALGIPRNTGELARLLGLSAGAVSQQLSRLHQAGLVEPRRVGKRVFYHLTERGKNLLALFA